MKTIFLFIILLFTASIFAQNVDFKAANFKDDKEGLKMANDAIKAGDEFYKAGNAALYDVQPLGLNFKQARQEYLKAQKFNPNNAELNFKLGVCYANSTSPFESIQYLKKAQQLDPECDPFMPYYYGYALQLEENFDEALKSYQRFETNYKKADNFTKFVNQRKKECTMAKQGKAKPVRAWVDNIPELSTTEDDYAPSISVDGSEIILSSNRPNGHNTNVVGEYDHDIYTSTLSDGKWSKPQQIKGKVNSNVDDISNNLSFDGTKMLFHREIDGQCDIYETKLSGVEWTDPVMLPGVISTNRSNEKFGAYSSDGWSVYFARDNENRSSGTEIMSSTMLNKMVKDYKIATPHPNVNSKFNDGPIYLHIDNETMYIASEGHESMGGYDIFISKKEQGQWGKPVNMGYPINTPYDDFFFASTANGKFAYIASNRAGGAGGYDIYKVTFWGPEKNPVFGTEDYLLASVAMPVKDNQIEASVAVNRKSFTVFKGTTIDAISRKPVQAEIEIIDNSNGKIIETITTNSATGKFLITLESGKNYGIAVKAEGYLFHSENFDLPSGSADNLVNKVIELKNIAVGSKIALRNIFFDTGKSNLRAESNAELDRLVKLMKDVPKLKIEISGHTDNTGSASTNETLSQQRADAVVAYLKTKGIDASRMTSRGYGSAQPVASNNNESGRQENRRTEFEIKAN